MRQPLEGQQRTEGDGGEGDSMATTSSGGRQGNGGGGGAVSVWLEASGSIPESVRNMVQNLKEIVGFPEQEIYAMLIECDMDASETVNRLLNQDTFHVVKKKREKKNKRKETSESNSRGASYTNCRGMGSINRAGYIGSNQSSSNDYGVNHGKPLQKKENWPSTVHSSSLLASGMEGNSTTWRSTPFSDAIPMDHAVQMTASTDGVPLSSQPSIGLQHSWLRVPGQLSMADIVKMGRPQARAPRTPSTEMSCPAHKADAWNATHLTAEHSTSTITQSESHYKLPSSEDLVSKDLDTIHEPAVPLWKHISYDGWSLEHPSFAGSGSSVGETSGALTDFANPSTLSNLHIDRDKLLLNSQIMEGKSDVDCLPEDLVRSIIDSEQDIHLKSSEGEPGFVEGSFKNLSSYQSQIHVFEHLEVQDLNEEVSFATSNLQQLSLHKEELGVAHADDNLTGIIPNHPQVINAECSHLSFGGFGSDVSGTFSGPFMSEKSYLEVASPADDISLDEHLDARNFEYYSSEYQRSTSNEIEPSRTITNAGNYDTLSSSQAEVIRSNTSDSMNNFHYNLPSSMHHHDISSTTQPSAEYAFMQANLQQQNLMPFSRVVMQAVMPRVLSTPQPTLQTLGSTRSPTGQSLPEHLSLHPSSHQTVPSRHPADLNSRRIQPQSYTYMPFASFQPEYTGSGAYHQSPVAEHGVGRTYTLPQYYHTSVSGSRLPQSAAVSSGYGGFAHVPGSFALNHTGAFQQSDDSTLPMHGASLGTPSALPASTYYRSQWQSQNSRSQPGQLPSNYGQGLNSRSQQGQVPSNFYDT